MDDLQTQISGTPSGKVVLSTIFKAYGSTQPIAQSADWIILVDEAHRTQEKDLGAYLRSTFPDARWFGFTGTPVKTTDLDTRANFGAKGEDYLDRYSIEDVPWTQYFEEGFALHTAFWHTQFGLPRSHGCVNMTPDDAHYVFARTWPQLPSGWHGVSTERTELRGSHVVVTD